MQSKVANVQKKNYILDFKSHSLGTVGNESWDLSRLKSLNKSIHNFQLSEWGKLNILIINQYINYKLV